MFILEWVCHVYSGFASVAYSTWNRKLTVATTQCACEAEVSGLIQNESSCPFQHPAGSQWYVGIFHVLKSLLILSFCVLLVLKIKMYV